MNLDLLKKLCFTHSVTGDTASITEFITSYLVDNNLSYTISGYGTILVGNTTNPKKLFTAHIDEVGFQITSVEPDGKIKILPVGWVFANRLDHMPVYINGSKGDVPGFIVHKELLKESNLKGFDSLYLDLGVDSAEEVAKFGVSAGDTGSFSRLFTDTSTAIIASGIDNKVAVCALIDLVISAEQDILEENCFAFVTDEEMQDHSANGLCHTVKADIAIVLDYCPTHQQRGDGDVIGNTGKGPIVMYRGGHYIINPKVRHYFESSISAKYQKGFFSPDTLPQLESSNFEDNGTTVAVNVCIPAIGYHGAAYLMRKHDIAEFEILLKNILHTNF